MNSSRVQYKYMTAQTEAQTRMWCKGFSLGRTRLKMSSAPTRVTFSPSISRQSVQSFIQRNRSIRSLCAGSINTDLPPFCLWPDHSQNFANTSAIQASCFQSACKHNQTHTCSSNCHYQGNWDVVAILKDHTVVNRFWSTLFRVFSADRFNKLGI